MLQFITKPNYLTFILALCFFSFNTLADAPANDLCEEAIELTCGTTLTNVDATTATNSGYPTECLAVSAAGVWYTFEGTGDLIDIVVSNETEFLEIHFFSGTCGDFTCLRMKSNPLKIDNYQTTDGAIYYFTVQTFYHSDSDAGTFDLSLTCSTPGCTDPDAHNYDENADVSDNSCETCDDEIKNGDETGVDCGGALCGPCIENDDVCDATSMELNTLMPFDFDGATVEDGEPSPGAGTFGCQSDDGWCGLETTLNNTVWFSFVAPESCIRITTSGTSGDTQIALWAVDDCGDFTTFDLEGANDDYSYYFFSSLIQTDLVPGTTYYLQIDEFDEDHGAATEQNDCIDCMVIVEEITCGCTDAYSHNYDENAVADDGSCETCSDGIQNGDELDVDCGGELCEPCPCTLEGEIDTQQAEGDCGALFQDRIVLVSFSEGYAPITYDMDNQAGTFITPKGVGLYQVIGNGPWSIEATDANGCSVKMESSQLVYVTNSSMEQESAIGAADGSATVEVTGGTAPYTVEWSNDVEGTIDESGGSHTNEDLAMGYYEAVVTDDDENTITVCIYVSRKPSNGGGRGRGRGRKTADVTELNTLMAQPNPFSSNSTVHFSLPEDAYTTVKIFSLDGRQMDSVFEGQATGGQDYTVELDASEWASGMYILHMTTDSGLVAHERLLITK